MGIILNYILGNIRSTISNGCSTISFETPNIFNKYHNLKTSSIKKKNRELIDKMRLKYNIKK